MHNQTEYHSQLQSYAEVIKRKQIKGITEDMNLSNNTRQTNDLLTDLSYDWSIGIKVIFKIRGYYISYSNISVNHKEVTV